jgi:hypothetical protein
MPATVAAAGAETLAVCGDAAVVDGTVVAVVDSEGDFAAGEVGDGDGEAEAADAGVGAGVGVAVALIEPSSTLALELFGAENNTSRRLNR